MSKSRRQFLVNAALAYFGASLIPSVHAQQTTEPPPGMPPAFGTAPPVGPEVSPATFAAARSALRSEVIDAPNFNLLAVDENDILNSIDLMDRHHLNHAEWGRLFPFDIVDACRVQQVEERSPESPRQVLPVSPMNDMKTELLLKDAKQRRQVTEICRSDRVLKKAA